MVQDAVVRRLNCKCQLYLAVKILNEYVSFSLTGAPRLELNTGSRSVDLDLAFYVKRPGSLDLPTQNGTMSLFGAR